MDQQLDNKAWASDWKGQRRTSCGTKQKPAQQAEMEPLTVTWEFEDEDVKYETRFQAGKAEEDSFSDCYIECIIRGEFADPILDEDILLKSFSCRKKDTDQGLSRPLLERSLGYDVVEERQELSSQGVGENSLVEYPGNPAGMRLLPGEKPRVDAPVPKQLPEFPAPMPTEKKEGAVPENICPQPGCAKKFKDKGSLKKHIRTHGPRNHLCAECGKAFLEKSKLNRHFLIHTGEKPFQCTYQGCGKRFALDFNLRAHVRIHTNERRYVCPVKGCNKTFVQSGHLKVHALSHAKTKKAQ